MHRLWSKSLIVVSLLQLAACTTSNQNITAQPKSIWALRYSGVVAQALDYSCGGAALATILTYYWGRKISEEFVLRILRARYPNPEDWKSKIEEGFNLDDLEFAAAALGFNSQSVRIPANELAKLNSPIIVHLDKGLFQHFSVLKKVHEGTVYLADPITGNRVLSLVKFKEQYSGGAMGVWLNDSDLPTNSKLQNIRDGMSLSATMSSAYSNNQRARRSPMFSIDFQGI